MKLPTFATNLLVLFSMSGCVCLGASAQQLPPLIIDVGQAGSFVTVRIINAKQDAIKMPGMAFALSDSAPGLHMSFSDKKRTIHSPCALLSAVHTGDYVVPSGGFLLTNLDVEFLKHVFCLSPGTYEVTATYTVGTMSSQTSSPLRVVIK